jgi:hypothetical protein
MLSSTKKGNMGITAHLYKLAFLMQFYAFLVSKDQKQIIIL